MRPLPLRGPAPAVAAVVLVLSTSAFFRVALLPSIGSSLALRAGLVSLVTVVFGVGRLLADIPAGRTADRVPPLHAFVASGVGLVFGNLLLAGAHGLTLLLLAAAVLGVASSITNTTGMTHFSRAALAVRGKSLALFSAALLGGQSLGPAIAGVVSSFGGWRAAELVAAAAALVAGVAALVLRGAPAPAHEQEESATPPVTHDVGGQRALLYVVAFAGFFVLAAMPQTLLPLIGAHGYGLGVGAIGVVLGVGGICRFVGAGIGGVVSDRVSRKAALVPSLVAMAAGCLLLEVPGGPVVWVGSVVLLSLGSFALTVAATMLADLGGGRRVGRRLGVFRFAGDFGLIAGPLAGGWLYDAFGTDSAVAAVAGVLLATALVAGAFLHETRHIEPAPLVEAAV